MAGSALLQMLPFVSVALAGTIQHPEVVPGPGLPSLESLSLTSEQLYQMGPPPVHELTTLSANFSPSCGPAEGAYTNVDGLIACYHYLDKLGTKSCRTPSGYKSIQFCYSGDASVTGTSPNGRSVSSYCRDVAKGLLYVIDHCTRPDHSCAGAQAAAGNGDLIVFGGDKRWG